MELTYILTFVLSVIPSSSKAQFRGLSIANCLEASGGQFNIGCPTFENHTAFCFLNGSQSDPSNPYSRLCDGVVDCVNNLRVDEGTNNLHAHNRRLDCGIRRYRCSDSFTDPNNTIAFTSLCDGIVDCARGDDETNFICDDKCRGEFNGNCGRFRMCGADLGGTLCGECFEGYLEVLQPQRACIPEPVEVAFDSLTYSVNSSFEVCVTLDTVTPMTSLGERIINVEVISQDREARAGVDFVKVDVALSFNDTRRVACFTVELEDSVVTVEGIETFLLRLVNPVPADVSDIRFSAGDTAMVIINDTSAIVVMVGEGGVVSEGAGEAVLMYSYVGVDKIEENISLAVNISTIPLTASAQDYEMLEAQLIFDSTVQPQMVQNLTIKILDDMIYEETESFQVLLTSNSDHVILFSNAANFSIVDNEVLTVLSASPGIPISVTEGGSTVVDFSLTGASEVADGVEIDLRVFTSDGSAVAGLDYIPASYSELLTNDSDLGAVRSLVLTTLPDQVLEGSERLLLTASSVGGEIVVVVNDNNSIEVNVSIAGDVMEFGEGAGKVVFEYFYSGVDSIAGSAQVLVDVTVDTMDAQLPENESQLVLDASSGPFQVRNFSVGIVDDSILEQTEMFLVRFNSSDATVTLTTDLILIVIQDNDELEVVVLNPANTSILEGETLSINFTFSGSATAIAEGVRVLFHMDTRDVTTEAELDYLSVNYTEVFTSDSDLRAVRVLSVETLDDEIVERDEYLSLVSNNDTIQLQVVIVNDDVLDVGIAMATYVVGEGEGSVLVCVEEEASRTGIPVQLLVSTQNRSAHGGEDFEAVSQIFTIDSTNNSNTTTDEMFPGCLRVSVLDDEALEGAETFQVELAALGGFEELVNLTRSLATVTILDNEELEVAFVPSSPLIVDEDVGIVSLSVSPRGPTDIAVNVELSLVTSGTATPGADFVLNTATLQFTSQSLFSANLISITILMDSITEGQEDFTISLMPIDNTINIAGDSNFTIFINDSVIELCTPSLCHPQAVCSEINNGTNASCDCVHPFVGDGFTNCSLFDPCLPSPCHPNATCIRMRNTSSGSGMGRQRSSMSGSDSIMPGFNSGGRDLSGSGSGSGMNGDENFTCVCNAQLVGDGRAICAPDPCDPSPCDENAVCEWFIDSEAAGVSIGFNCTCNISFVGDGFTCSQVAVGDDPHFSVVLPSRLILCYSIQGDHYRAYNLLRSRKFQMNAVFLPDSDLRKKVTWIGTLGLVFRDQRNVTLKDLSIKLESKGAIISVKNKGNFTAKTLSAIHLKNGKLRLLEATPTDEFRYPMVRISLEDLGLSFSVKFVREHLDLFWHSSMEQSDESDGLIGQFLRRGIEIDEVRRILIMPGMEPVPVRPEPVWRFMERREKSNHVCWRAMNYGYQGEGLIVGSYRDYEVEHVLHSDL